MALENIFAQLESMGIIVFLIFALVFTLVFAILQKISLFGDPKKDPKVKTYNSVIALVMAALVVFPHVLWGSDNVEVTTLSNGMPDVVNIIASSLPSVGIVLVAILMALLIIGLLGKRFELGGTSLSGWIALGAFAVVLYIFGSSAGWWSAPGFMNFLLYNEELTALILVILVFAIIIWFVTKEDKPASDENSLARQLDKMLK
jgi:hypothetical protein